CVHSCPFVVNVTFRKIRRSRHKRNPHPPAAIRRKLVARESLSLRLRFPASLANRNTFSLRRAVGDSPRDNECRCRFLYFASASLTHHDARSGSRTCDKLRTPILLQEGFSQRR